MPSLATWLREKDEKWFQPFFDKHPEIGVHNACFGDATIDAADGFEDDTSLRQSEQRPSPSDRATRRRPGSGSLVRDRRHHRAGAAARLSFRPWRPISS